MESDFDDLIGDSEEGPPAEKKKAGRPPNVTSIAKWTDPKQIINFINQMQKLPIEAIDDIVINQGYAAAVWQFRAAALTGDYTMARALEIWLKWAAPHLAKPKREKMKVIKHNGADFGPRKTADDPKPDNGGELI